MIWLNPDSEKEQAIAERNFRNGAISNVYALAGIGQRIFPYPYRVAIIRHVADWVDGTDGVDVCTTAVTQHKLIQFLSDSRQQQRARIEPSPNAQYRVYERALQRLQSRMCTAQ